MVKCNVRKYVAKDDEYKAVIPAITYLYGALPVSRSDDYQFKGLSILVGWWKWGLYFNIFWKQKRFGYLEELFDK